MPSMREPDVVSIEDLDDALDPDSPASSEKANARRSETERADSPNLLTIDEDEAGRIMLRDWNDSNHDVKRFKEQWKVNRARSEGYTGVALIKEQDKNVAYIPLGAKKHSGGMNLAIRLRRKLRATLFADPALPEATPSTDDDEDREAAETSTRVLQDVTSEGQLDMNTRAGNAFDLAADYGSGFLRFWVDEYGGGWQPKMIMAHPSAETEDDPFPIVELPSQDPNQPPQQYQTQETEAMQRYVLEDGTLVDDPTTEGIAMEWLPGLKLEELTGKQVRFIPSNVNDVWDAEGMMVGAMVPWGFVKANFREAVEGLDKDRMAAMMQHRPEHAKDLMPVGRKNDPTRRDDERLVFVLTRYHRQCYEYPKGAYLIMCGDGVMLHRGEWFDAENNTPLDIPIAQFKQYFDEDNPYGIGIMEWLGPANEVRTQMMELMLEHLDRFANRKIFAPITSAIQPHQLQAPMGTPIPIVPGGQPFYEDVPDFPVIVEKMYNMVGQDMNDESGLSDAARGMNPSGVKSGLHAERIIEQVNIGLSDLRQNCIRGFIRAWRICLQLIRAYYSTSQRTLWLGEDGAYKEFEWRGADLGSTRDLRLQRGSFTQLAPSAKAALAQAYAQSGILSPQDLQRVIIGNVGGLIGSLDNPHRMRVRMQISRWRQGPPDGWQFTPAMVPNPQAQQYAQAAQQGQVPPGTPPPPAQVPGPPLSDPELADVFQQLPVDDEPQVAPIRALELGRAVASASFNRHEKEWQGGLIQAYQMARQAAGIMSIQQMQQMQAQAAQQEAQAEGQKEAAKEQARAQARSQESQQKGQVELQKEDKRTQRELTKTKMQTDARREAEKADIQAALADRLPADRLGGV